MRYPTLLLWALPFFLGIHGRSISSRQNFVSSQQNVVSQFSQVQHTYTVISTRITQSRQSIETSFNYQECSSIIAQLTAQIEEAVNGISNGCDCPYDDIDTEALEASIASWFAELQAITQTVQNRFPTHYRQLTSSFTQISTQLQVALGVSVASGVYVDNVVQRAINRSRINPNSLSTVGINMQQFTSVSQQYQQRTGVYTTRPKPVGRKYRGTNQAHPPIAALPSFNRDPTQNGHQAVPSADMTRVTSPQRSGAFFPIQPSKSPSTTNLYNDPSRSSSNPSLYNNPSVSHTSKRPSYESPASRTSALLPPHSTPRPL